MPVFIVPVTFEVPLVAKDAKEAAKLVKQEYARMEFDENHLFDVGTPVRIDNVSELPGDLRGIIPWNGDRTDAQIEEYIHCCPACGKRK